ncbi:hypothetical protein KKC45_01600 [Patescibacteria group bacterium]|nr:hypothetical protein [Patescibacteria group bacterium]
MKKQFSPFFVLLVLFCFAGCAKQDTGSFKKLQMSVMNVSFGIVDNKEVIYDGRKQLEISKEVKSLSFLLRVDNPYKLDYQIWSEMIDEDGQSFNLRRWYSSNREFNNKPYKIDCPLDNHKKVFFVVSVRDHNGQVLFELLPLEYQVQQEEIEQGGY